MSFDEQLARIRSRLTAEERRDLAVGITEVASRREERRAIGEQIDGLEREVRLLAKRLNRLPPLPDPVGMRWARSVLAYPNACVLAIDTAPSARGEGIARVLLLCLNGVVHFETQIAQQEPLSDEEARALEYAASAPRGLPSLPQVWPAFLGALEGRFVVSFDLERLRQVLEKEAEQCGLEPPVILGDCLLRRCLSYFPASGFAGLESLCGLAGYPLPVPPGCTASAWGQLHLLKAMAQGICDPGQETPK